MTALADANAKTVPRLLLLGDVKLIEKSVSRRRKALVSDAVRAALIRNRVGQKKNLGKNNIRKFPSPFNAAEPDSHSHVFFSRFI